MAQKIETLLRELGWPKAELARRIGVSPSAVGRWCRGHEPRSVVWGLEMAVALKRAVTDGSELLAVPRRRSRGRHVPARGEVFELSAAQAAGSQAPPADYLRNLERWEESDMDQSEGRG